MEIKLDASQAKVVAWHEGPALVNAGPGSGKTRVVVERIKRLAEFEEPSSILATTFTKKAAEEMQNRLKHCRKASRVKIQTTHSYAYGLLRKHPKYGAFQLDEKDQAKTTLKKILGFRDMRWKIDISLVISFIATMRAKLISPEETQEYVGYPLFVEAYTKYHAALDSAAILTFDDMLYYGARLLRDDKEIRAREQGQYKFVIVDEAQDCNHAQIVLTSTIAAPEQNIMLVGDVDQAIYAWRGAIPEYFLEFPEKYQAEVFDLGRNYRCPKVIVEKASLLIARNVRRFSKELVSKDLGGSILVIQEKDANAEANRIGEMIEESFCDWKDNAILIRMNAHTRAFEEEFPRRKIPFVIWGDTSFYERKEIQDLLAYLRVIVRPEDHISGVRAINRPFRYVSTDVIRTIVEKSHQLGFFKAVEAVSNAGFNSGLNNFLSLFFDVTKETSPAEFLRKLIPTYLPYLVENEGTDSLETSRTNNVYELVKCAERFSTMTDFVRFVDSMILQRMKTRHTKNAVQIMTIHRAKGCEFENVYLINANAGIVPHERGEIEEERRLAYVAMTRAKRMLVVSSQTNREMSPFAYEATICTKEEALTPKDEETTNPQDV